MLQEYLNVIRKMYPTIPELVVDGIYGPKTQRAVKIFQELFSLQPTGVVDPDTWKKIVEQYQIALKSNETTVTSNYFNYTVLPGDSLWDLAIKFGTTIKTIKTINNLLSDVIVVGQTLKIPNSQKFSKTFDYIVQPGDSLWLISQKFKTTVYAIKSINNLKNNIIIIGQTLKIPTSSEVKPMLPIPSKTIIIDAGHGGEDPGASNGYRLEKNDNLRLALAVQKKLQEQGQNVIMTRDTDIFIPLDERSAISNRNNADLFVSLHRNSNANSIYSGVDNFVHNEAPQTTFKYAQNVIDEIAKVGVQNNRGVSRANFAVLRNTNAPSMLVEMGFISNEKDNNLFDQNFDAYANAITRGIMESLFPQIQ